MGMSAACGAAWNIIEVVDAFNLEGDLPVAFDEGEVATIIHHSGEIHNFAVFQIATLFDLQRLTSVSFKISRCPLSSNPILVAVYRRQKHTVA